VGDVYSGPGGADVASWSANETPVGKLIIN
jgi:hypothetical protein